MSDVTKPITDEMLAELDATFSRELNDRSTTMGAHDMWFPMGFAEYIALRQRLCMAESYGKGFENVRLDLVNERNELGRRLALADAVVEAAARVLQRSTYVTIYFPEFAASVASHRAAEEPPIALQDLHDVKPEDYT
jgi:hypothetical protein